MSVNPVLNEAPVHELDYQLCGFEGSKLRFRGPKPDLDIPFVAVLGGSESFGKYVSEPYPAMLGAWLDMPVMNFGVTQAGLSLFSEEHWLLDMASKAEFTVLQVLGAQNMSNRLYSVHARRNDRFIGVSPALREIFPDVDFTEINFTGHLLETLRTTSPAGFKVVVEELKWSWVQRMRRVVNTIRNDVFLLWISDHSPQETTDSLDELEPHFVDQNMLDALSGDIAGLVKVVRPPVYGLEGKICPREETSAAKLMPGPAEHAQIAEAVISTLEGSADKTGPARAARS